MIANSSNYQFYLENKVIIIHIIGGNIYTFHFMYHKIYINQEMDYSIMQSDNNIPVSKGLW